MRILFWGTPEFAVPSLRALDDEGFDIVGVVTQPDRPAGRGRHPRASPVKSVALDQGMEVLTPESPREAGFIDAIRALETRAVDIAIVSGGVGRPWLAIVCPPRQQPFRQPQLDELLHAQRITQVELAQRIGITAPNLNILKTGKAKAIRFSTLSAICRELRCQPGDILRWEDGNDEGE